MKVAFDTSVLVPALVRSHPWHSRAIIWLDAASQGTVQGTAGWHAIAETWSVLTRLPLKPGLSAERARLVVERLQDSLQLIEPTAETYEQALVRCAKKGLISGAVFDALHMVTAETAGAEFVLTFNPGDFDRLRDESGPGILVPPDPPSLDIDSLGG